MGGEPPNGRAKEGQRASSQNHSQHTNTQTVTPSKSFTPRTHHTRFILMLTMCDVYRAHRHGSESPHPGSTPGLNPCKYHLARQACGPWRTHRHNTYIQAHRQRRHEELMIHRIRRAAQPRRRGHHRAGGAGAVAVDGGGREARERVTSRPTCALSSSRLARVAPSTARASTSPHILPSATTTPYHRPFLTKRRGGRPSGG